jgi:hypothetical protein
LVLETWREQDEFYEDLTVITNQLQETSELLAPTRTRRFSPDWFAENVLHPAINEGPFAVYNTAADLAHLPALHLKTEEAAPYSPEWFAQGLASGVGAAVPMALMCAVTGSLAGALERKLAGSSLGTALSPYLASKKIAAVSGASLYAALKRPDAEHTRLGNAIGTAAGIMVLSAGNSSIKDMPFLHKALAYPVVGLIGGATMTGVSQLASSLKLASGEQMLQGAIQGMTMNTVMGLASDFLNTQLERDQLRSEERTARTRRAEALPSGNEVKEAKDAPASSGPEANMARVPRLDRDYTEHVRSNSTHYPNYDAFDVVTTEDAETSGTGLADGFKIKAGLRGDRTPRGVRADGRPRWLPKAGVVAEEVGKAIEKMPLASDSGDITVGEWNMEFLTADKARYFRDTYGKIVPRLHLLFVEEGSQGGLKQLAQDTGYNFAVSRENSRGQAVGFLVNPRLKIMKTTTIDAVAEIQDIPDLRPALRVDLRDSASGQEFSAVVVHLKSMRGGPDSTAPIRTYQAQVLAKELGPTFKGIAAGDWNTFLDKTTELQALKESGFKMSNPESRTSTHSNGGRLDGFFARGLNLSPEKINPFFSNPLVTRVFSDHALLTTSLNPGK